MKKLLLILLAVSVMVFASSCSAADNLGIPSIPEVDSSAVETPEVQAETEESEVQDTCTLNILDTDSVTVSICNTEPELEYDPNPDDEDNIILSYLLEKPIVSIDGNPEATHKINDYLYLLDEAYRYGELSTIGFNSVSVPAKGSILEAATDNYSRYFYSGEDVNLEFSFSHMVDIKRCDSCVISFIFTDYLYMGSGEGEYSQSALSFDVTTGEQILIDSVCDSSALKEAIIRSLPSGIDSSEAEVLTENIDTLVEGKLWYISNDSIVFLYNTSENYDGNSVEIVELKVTDNEALFNATYFAQWGNTSGKVEILSANNNLVDKDIIDSVVVKEEGDCFYIVVSGAVTDVRVYNVQYSDSEGMFFSKSLLWSCNYISDSILQINTIIPEGMPDLMLSYTSNGEECSKLISNNGINGDPVLVDSSISAVG